MILATATVPTIIGALIALAAVSILYILIK